MSAAEFDGGHHFDGEVRCHAPEAHGDRIIAACRRDECDIRSADRRRMLGQQKSGFDHHSSHLVPPHERIQRAEQIGDDHTVTGAGSRLAHQYSSSPS
jgi:hypothetical protein